MAERMRRMVGMFFRRLFQQWDQDQDNRVSMEEWQRLFQQWDANGDGMLTEEEMWEGFFRTLGRGRGGPLGGPPNVKPPKADERPRPPQRGEGPKVGEEAPDFTLKTLDGEGEVTLSSFRGKKPVVLIFGSYT
jgi:hypothetical protein